MLSVIFAKNPDQGIKILCLGAHSDDIEIGCGGTMLSILATHPQCEVDWVVFSSDSRREEEARSSAKVFLERAEKKTIAIGSFRNGFFPYVGAEIKEYFEAMKTKVSPDVIFTHYRNDLHQDHRTVSELTWNTFRNQLILEYEVPKYDGDIGTPNFFVPIEPTIGDKKVRNIITGFQSQGDKHWFTEDLLHSMLRVRGMECCSPTRYAEAFYCRKIVFQPWCKP